MKRFYVFIAAALLPFFVKAQCTASVVPYTRTLSCNGFPATFTGTPGPGTKGQWFDAASIPVSTAANTVVLLSTGNAGVYNFVATDTITMCTAIKSVTVYADPSVPSMTINAISGTNLGCSACLPFNITSSPGPAPKTYSWTSLSSSVTATPSTGAYTICTAGAYYVEYQDGNYCRISETIYISNTPCATGIEALNAEKEGLVVSPNPGNGSFSFKNSAGDGELQIVNSLGALVHRQILTKGDNAVTVDLAKGIYYYTVLRENRSIGKGKLLIE